jgi:hypothetical protein
MALWEMNDGEIDRLRLKFSDVLDQLREEIWMGFICEDLDEDQEDELQELCESMFLCGYQAAMAETGLGNEKILV